jgi:hypothetical protein
LYKADYTNGATEGLNNKKMLECTSFRLRAKTFITYEMNLIIGNEGFSFIKTQELPINKQFL